VLKQIEYQPVYPMDFYAADSLGPWTPKHVSEEDRTRALKRREENMRRRAQMRVEAAK
jgi:hypothetical protein